MFIRWQQIKRGKNEHWGAVLASSARVNGKPKQTHIANLGWIQKTEVPVGAGRARFWEDVLAALEKLEVPAAERRKLEAAVALKVPPPTAAQRRDYAELRRRVLKLERKLHTLERDLKEAYKLLRG
jgi:hypothetical protein